MPWDLRGRLGRTLALAAAAGSWIVWLLAAADPSDLRVAVVNTQKVTARSTSIQAEIAAASAGARALGEELGRRQEESRRAVEQFESQKTVATEEENQARLARLQALESAIETLSADLAREIARAQQEAVEPLRLKIEAAIAEEARRRGLWLVLAAEHVVYFHPSLDLTAAVTERLDAPR